MSRMGAAAQCIALTLSKKCSPASTHTGLPVLAATPGAVVPTASSERSTPRRVAMGISASCERPTQDEPIRTPVASVSMAEQLVVLRIVSSRGSSSVQAWRR